MIDANKLTYNYNKNYFALLNIDFKVDDNPLLIIGEDGAGKTTLLNILAGLQNDYEGSLKIDGVERRDISLIGSKISYILDPPLFFTSRSVYHNLKYAIKQSCTGLTKEGIKTKIKELALEYGLVEILSKPIKKINEFQKQLVALARAEVKKPQILLLDEPLKNLISIEKIALLQRVFSVARKLSSGLIIAEKNENRGYFGDVDVLKLESGTNLE